MYSLSTALGILDVIVYFDTALSKMNVQTFTCTHTFKKVTLVLPYYKNITFMFVCAFFRNFGVLLIKLSSERNKTRSHDHHRTC